MGNRQEFRAEFQYNLGGRCAKMLKQDYATEKVEPQAHYSPEEAGEILRLAANLQENTITAEQLRTIAREAGVSDENLERAIQQYEQNRRAETLRKQRDNIRKREFRLFVLSVVLTCVVYTGGMLWMARESMADSPITPSFTSESVSRELLASSRTCKIFKERRQHHDSITIQRSDGHEFVVGAHFGDVSFASISPSGRHVAIYDSETGNVWVVNTDGEALQKVVSAGESFYHDGSYSVVAHDNPVVGWSTSGGDDALRIQLYDGRSAEIRLPAQ
jgi:hypothetical protein